METEAAPVWSPAETEQRIIALDRAINYHQNREADPDKVVDTAKTFLAFIGNESAYENIRVEGR